MEFTIEEIAALLGGTIEGNPKAKIHKLAKIEEGDEGSISFLSNPKYENHLYSSNASAVIVQKDFSPKREVKSTLIRVEDPYSCFSSLLHEYQRRISTLKTGIESPSYIADSASVGEGIYRGAFSYIGEGSKIGDHVKIYPNAYVGDNVTIGDNTTLYAGCKIYPGTVIGSNCTIHSGAVIGSDGFGFAPQEDGTYNAIPQVGNVIIEDNVSIGANSTIDCATMESTVIRQGVKLDNLIQVAHNVDIGENTVIAAQAGVSGSSKIGKNCVIAGQVGIVGHLQIADKVIVGAQAGVTKSHNNPGTTILGSPAMDHLKFARITAGSRLLPDLGRRLKSLEREIEDLKSR